MQESVTRYTYIESPVGALLLAGSDQLLECVSFPSGHGVRKPKPHWQEDAGAFAETSRQLRAWFAGDILEFDLPLEPAADPFAAAVRKAMLAIPYGETATYGEVARSIGEPVSASRAIGAACGANPLPIIVPCHRVVGAGGSLTGFGGGLETKKMLLDLEFRRRPPSGTLFSLA